MGKMIVCPNCGKEYDEDLPKCPSCDSTNLKGAEKEYLKQLENVREDMEDLEEVSGEEIRREVKSQSRRIRKILLICLGTVAALAAVFYISRNGICRDERDYKAEYLWQQENFPEMDRLYEAGDYEALYTFCASEENAGESGMYSWEHYPFVMAYSSCKSVEQYLEYVQETPRSEGVLTLLFSYEWDVKGILQHQEDYTEAEFAALQPMLEKSEADFESRWRMSPEEYEALYTEFENAGGIYLDYNTCKEYVKNWLKENR